MYCIVYLALSLAATVSVDILDNADGEWVAPGYSVTERVLIDPYDYVTAIENDPRNIACQAFFVDTEQGEKWRVIMVGSDKLVVLQEDREAPLEVVLPFSAYGAIYSRGGYFVIVRYGTADMNMDQALYVDIDRNVTKYFDPTPDGRWCHGMAVSDNGVVTAIGKDYILDFDENLALSSIREYEETHFGYKCTSATDEIIVMENVYDSPREIMAFDWDGNQLWETDIGERAVVTQLAASEDGSLVGASFIKEGISVIDGNTGRILWERYDGMQTSTIAFSPDGTHMAITVPLEVGELPNSFVITDTGDQYDDNDEIWCIPSRKWYYIFPDMINNNTNVLFHSQDVECLQITRICLLDSDGVLIWSSEPVKSDERSFIPFGNSFNLDYHLLGPPHALSMTDSRVVYQGEDGVTIITVSNEAE
ncbi:MAG: hypothetical protein K8S15_11415 [Candidatus Aegiribacteria sp.]|nr:hypothetical protein [Candidatus Aegiribacteria sp.]